MALGYASREAASLGLAILLGGTVPGMIGVVLVVFCVRHAWEIGFATASSIAGAACWLLVAGRCLASWPGPEHGRIGQALHRSGTSYKIAASAWALRETCTVVMLSLVEIVVRALLRRWRKVHPA